MKCLAYVRSHSRYWACSSNSTEKNSLTSCSLYSYELVGKCLTSVSPSSCLIHRDLEPCRSVKSSAYVVHRAEERSEESSLILDTFISTMRHSSATGYDCLLWSLSPIKFSANILEFENGPRIYKTLGITVLAHFLYSFTMTFFQENLLFLWASHHESTSQLGWHILRGRREYCLRVWIFKSNSCVTFSGELTSLYLSFLIFRRRIIPVPSPRIVVKVKWVNLSPSANNSSQPIKVPNKGQKVLIFPLPLYLPFSAFSSFTKAAQYTQLLMPET